MFVWDCTEAKQLIKYSDTDTSPANTAFCNPNILIHGKYWSALLIKCKETTTKCC